MGLRELVEDRYHDRGGWKQLDEIFRSTLPYDAKIDMARDKYRVSRGQVVRWYAQYRALVGLK